MLAIAALLTTIILSIVITRVATVILTLTGVSSELAHFQARSAFTGVGFTTAEAESVVSHPVRRRVMLVLMLLGNAGLVTIVASLVLGFSQAGGLGAIATRLGILFLALLLLWWASSSAWVNRRLEALIQAALRRWSRLEVRDYAHLLQLEGDYGVRELRIDADDWLADRPLRELDLAGEGVLVLGIRRADGDFLGAPAGDTVLHPGDNAILYGRAAGLAELDERRRDESGQQAHEQAKADQRTVQADQRARDATRESR